MSLLPTLFCFVYPQTKNWVIDKYPVVKKHRITVYVDFQFLLKFDNVLDIGVGDLLALYIFNGYNIHALNKLHTT